MLVCALVARKKINGLMSCYQILRVALQELVSRDWTITGFRSGVEPPAGPSLDAFHGGFATVFVDSGGQLNLCADVSRESYRWLQHEASLALQYLDDATSHGFEALFMKPVPMEQKFDLLCQ